MIALYIFCTQCLYESLETFSSQYGDCELQRQGRHKGQSNRFIQYLKVGLHQDSHHLGTGN